MHPRLLMLKKDAALFLDLENGLAAPHR